MTFPINHVALTVSDLDRSRAFYAGLLGLLGYRHVGGGENDPERPDGCFGVTFFAAGPPHDVWLNLWQARPGARPRESDYDVGLHHLALHAETRAVVDAVYAYAGSQGVALLDPPAPREYGPDYCACYFRDPDGIKLEIATMRLG